MKSRSNFFLGFCIFHIDPATITTTHRKHTEKDSEETKQDQKLPEEFQEQNQAKEKYKKEFGDFGNKQTTT